MNSDKLFHLRMKLRERGKKEGRMECKCSVCELTQRKHDDFAPKSGKSSCFVFVK